MFRHRCQGTAASVALCASGITDYIFKDRLSKYLRLAVAGGLIVITSHQKPVATLNPIPRTGKPGLQQLLASGKVTWRGTRAYIDPHRPVAPICGSSIVDTVLQDRE